MHNFTKFGHYLQRAKATQGTRQGWITVRTRVLREKG